MVCVGGAAIGSSVAYFLGENPDFDGTVLVVEPDPTYVDAQSTRAGNSIREQFSSPVNIRISQFGMDFIAEFRERAEVNGDCPLINFRGTGYLFLAATDHQLDELRLDREVQVAHDADVRLLTVEQIAAEFPYLDATGLVGAWMGNPREGSFDGWALLQGFRRRAQHRGVTYVRDRVVDLQQRAGRVTAVVLESGRRVHCGQVVNAAGTRAAAIARMAGLHLPVEPRARTTFVFACRTPIDSNVPLTVTPEGVHFRREQQQYVTGTVPLDDRAVDPGDLDPRNEEFEELIWPVLARYVPQFDHVKVVASWGGQYAYNTLDHNLVIGASADVPNFYFANGFSGHGLQQAPAVGRAISELITYGEFRTIDMRDLAYDRVLRNEPLLERLVI